MTFMHTVDLLGKIQRITSPALVRTLDICRNFHGNAFCFCRDIKLNSDF